MPQISLSFMSDSDVDLTAALPRILNFTKTTKNILYINILWTHCVCWYMWRWEQNRNFMGHWTENLCFPPTFSLSLRKNNFVMQSTYLIYSRSGNVISPNICSLLTLKTLKLFLKVIFFLVDSIKYWHHLWFKLGRHQHTVCVQVRTLSLASTVWLHTVIIPGCFINEKAPITTN